MKVLKCKACGAFLEYKVGAPVSICGYCDIVNIISEDVLTPLASKNEEIQNLVGEAMQVEEKYLANNYIALGVSQGGRLLISKNEIFFRPHKLNFGDLSDKYLKIDEIITFEKPVFPMFLKIHATRNRVMFLSTWSRNKIIKSIQSRK